MRRRILGRRDGKWRVESGEWEKQNQSTFHFPLSTFQLAYNLLLPIGILCYLLYAFFIKRKKISPIGSRLGKIPPDKLKALQSGEVIWIQAVSVGEVMSAAPLIERLRQQFPEKKILLTTTTPKGLGLAQRYEKNGTVVTLFPLDFPWAMRKFIRQIHPTLFIMVESEFWPNCIAELSKKKIPMALVNGRISPRSLWRYRCLRWAVKEFSSKVQVFCMQSELDAQRLRELGISPKKIQFPGNLKFDAGMNHLPLLGEGLKEHFANRAVWVAGSTHDPEEKILFSIYQRLKKDRRGFILVLAPRHVERFAGILEWFVSQGEPLIQWSQYRRNPTPLPSEGVVMIVDIMGELRTLYSLATVVFIGGSLVPHGGQNPLEAASLAKPILWGPHFFNFQDIQDQFLSENAAWQVQGPEALESALQSILNDPAQAQEMGQRARRIVERNQGATERTLVLLKPLLYPTP